MNEHYKYLRKLKRNHLLSMEKQEFPIIDELRADSFEKAIILPLKKDEKNRVIFGCGGVVDCNGRYIEDSAVKGRVEYPYEFDSHDYKDENVVYCGYLINHWGHFLTETIPRLWYFLENDKNIDKYVFFVENGIDRSPCGNFREFLQLFGVFEKLEIINKPTQYKSVIVPQLSYKRREYYSEKYKDIFYKVSNSISINNSWIKHKKIFFSRSQLEGINKKEIGHDCMDSFFKRNGYELIFPEKLSLSELIFYMNNAEVIATISGTLQHNILFAQDNKYLVILERNVLINDIQLDVNLIKKANYVYIDSQYTVYNVSEGFGPFMMCYTDQFKQFAKENKLLNPDKKYLNEKYKKKILKKYMKAYINTYDYSCHIEQWHFIHLDYIVEAIKSAEKIFYVYIHREKTMKISDLFHLHYIKRIIRGFIK